MSDMITFFTADEPAFALAVPRAALFNSAVFAAMEEVGGTNAAANGEFVTLAEKQYELEPFFAALQGKAESEQLETLTEVRWESLARLADKYDSENVRLLVRCRIWSFIAESKAPTHIFSLAALLNDKVLLNRTALQAACRRARKVVRPDRFGAGLEWQERLDDWLVKLEAHAFACIVRYDFAANDICESSNCHRAAALLEWQNRLRLAMEGFEPKAPYARPFRYFIQTAVDLDLEGPDAIEVCPLHRHIIMEDLQALQHDYASAMPPFLP
ncbi:hypothetical protein JCM10213_005430 [Rhodosporidiobolus nylandii]